jgi:hypothetical protein
LILGAGCAPDLAPKNLDGGADGGTGPRVVSVDNGDGTTDTSINATNQSDWIYFDFESRSEIAPAMAEGSKVWDLALERFKIKVNGGVSGVASVEVAALPGVDFGGLSQAPASGYATDAAPADSADGGFTAGTDGLAFEAGDGWYAYDLGTHVLTPRPVVYVVHTGEGNYYKLQILGYYDQAGTPGHMSFKWAPVQPPSGSGTLQVDASSASAWTYVSIVSGAVITVSSPATSTDWDLAFQKAQIQTNSGSSGLGKGGALVPPQGIPYDSATQSDTIGFTVDSMLPVPGPPGSGMFSGNPMLSGTDGTNGWFDYDMSSHTVTPKPIFFFIRTANGNYGKLQITAYAGGIYTIKVAPVVRNVSVRTIDVDASSSTTWVYLNLRTGSTADVTSPATDASWDLAIQRTQFQTNGGTSGAGLGGAGDPMAADLSAIVSSSMAQFSPDSMIPIPGPPGSGEFSGNPVLNDWYDYDMSTHVVTPKDKSFLVRTADGGDTKLKIISYADGKYTLAWAYAGPGRTDF